MSISIKKAAKVPAKEHLVVLTFSASSLATLGLNPAETKYAKAQLKQKTASFSINQYHRQLFFVLQDNKSGKSFEQLEKARVSGYHAAAALNQAKVKRATLVNLTASSPLALAVAEGIVLSNYQFLKYFKDTQQRQNSLAALALHCKDTNQAVIKELNAITAATCYSRTLVNEPLSFLTAEQLGKEIVKLGKEAGFKTEVLNKSKIASLKMGGLLAVNRGSIDPPTFSILEWKPKKAKNSKPIVLVGKGVVYDTGGLSLKPTPNSMDIMKCDMGGAAAVIGAMYAVAKNELPVHVIALVPATDNRPGVNAYVPGDVVTMHNGLTVEVLNTDAEGRMLLADALSYAQKYDPMLVMDAATLTGAAARAIGRYGVVVMGNAGSKHMKKLQTSGENVYERTVEFPFWEEYDAQMKSKIADLKNIGGPEGGAITAGKFLEHFTDYPYIHCDIAGPAFLDRPDTYRSEGGTGVGVRLFYDFIKNI